MIVHLNLATETERVLREKAARRGRSLEAYLEEIADREARDTDGASDQAPTDAADFERCLDELREGLAPLVTLPADFSRADIYGEHA
ncbi:MAG TPA: hypothetical protein VJ739_08305 [Gemmataceae bacterium]|nr:hypothetical protein [Gemmataceae bacterium]